VELSLVGRNSYKVIPLLHYLHRTEYWNHLNIPNVLQGVANFSCSVYIVKLINEKAEYLNEEHTEDAE
jgi:hypothetical protein